MHISTRNLFSPYKIGLMSNFSDFQNVSNLWESYCKIKNSYIFITYIFRICECNITTNKKTSLIWKKKILIWYRASRIYCHILSYVYLYNLYLYQIIVYRLIKWMIFFYCSIELCWLKQYMNLSTEFLLSRIKKLTRLHFKTVWVITLVIFIYCLHVVYSTYYLEFDILLLRRNFLSLRHKIYDEILDMFGNILLWYHTDTVG